MKNRLKLTLLLTAITLLFAVSAKAQIYDGITQPTRFPNGYELPSFRGKDIQGHSANGRFTNG